MLFLLYFGNTTWFPTHLEEWKDEAGRLGCLPISFLEYFHQHNILYTHTQLSTALPTNLILPIQGICSPTTIFPFLPFCLKEEENYIHSLSHTHLPSVASTPFPCTHPATFKLNHHSLYLNSYALLQ